MRVLLVLGIAAALGACHVEPSRPSATPATSVVRKANAAVALPRYFPRAAPLTIVGQTDEGTAAMAGSIRVLLRDDGLPDASPWLVSVGAGTTESGGTPTGAAGNAIAVPARLGGGWLFVVGRELWHAPSWLARPVRLFELTSVPRIHLGLTAPVAQEAGRPPFAFRVSDGQSVPLEHWPLSPAVAELASRDATHAAVVADLRGLSITEDGGLTWRPIASSRTPLGVRVAPGGYLVRGRNGSDDHEVTWHVDVHGEPRGESAVASTSKPAPRLAPSRAWERVIERGLDDSARDRLVVLDHGVLERYRKSDGVLLGRTDVGDPRDTCQPIHRPGAAGEAELACTGPAGTSLWRVGDTDAIRFHELPGERRIWSSEVGTLAVEGACEATPSAPDVTTLCVWSAGPTPRTVRLQGATRDDLLVPLPDGSIVVLRPPSGPLRSRRGAEMFVDRAPAAGSSTPAEHGRVQGVPLRAAGVWKADVTNHVTQGRWLDHVEALPNGGIAGWIEHEGRIVGYRVGPDGAFEVGPRSMVATTHRMAGLRSLSWSQGGSASESTDGGMHYTQIGLPSVEATEASRSQSNRDKPAPVGGMGCTALGCILPNVLRVGWGAETDKPAPRPSSWPSASLASGRIALDCTALARTTDTAPARIVPQLRSVHGALPSHGFGIGPGSVATTFWGTPPPKARPEQVLQSWDTVDLADRRSLTFTGRVFSWGTYSLGPDPDAGWQWRWYDARTRSTHATAIARPPAELAVSQAMQSGMGSRGTWTIASAVEPRHALGFQSDGSRTLVFSLVDGEAPARIELADGGEIGLLESGLAAPGDRAVLAGPVGDPAGTAVYLARGTRAERVATIPRLGVQGRPNPALVALHTDGMRIAVAVEDRDLPSRSDVAFFVREAYPDEGPIRRFGLDSAASGMRRTLRACTSEPGFEAWTKLELAGDLTLSGSTRTAHLGSPTRAKVRFQDDGAICLVELTSSVDSDGLAALAAAALHPGNVPADSVPVVAGHSGRLYMLACNTK